MKSEMQSSLPNTKYTEEIIQTDPAGPNSDAKSSISKEPPKYPYLSRDSTLASKLKFSALKDRRKLSEGSTICLADKKLHSLISKYSYYDTKEFENGWEENDTFLQLYTYEITNFTNDDKGIQKYEKPINHLNFGTNVMFFEDDLKRPIPFITYYQERWFNLLRSKKSIRKLKLLIQFSFWWFKLEAKRKEQQQEWS